MHSILVVTHIALMISSLVLMPTAVIMALNGIKSSLRIATIGFSTTVLGFIAGVVLLFSHPLLSECVILTSYLFATIALYSFGFGWGVVGKARLLREKP